MRPFRSSTGDPEARATSPARTISFASSPLRAPMSRNRSSKSAGLRPSPRRRFCFRQPTTPSTGPSFVWMTTRWPRCGCGSKPPRPRTASRPSLPTWVMTRPISSMGPTIARSGPPVPGTRTHEEPSTSAETSPNARAASRHASAAGSSWPDGPGASSSRASVSGMATARDSTARLTHGLPGPTLGVDGSRLPQLVGLALNAGREPARAVASAHTRSASSGSERSLFVMSAISEIATDLLTPLGAYLRLREGAPAAFLLESVERGRLGRHSFVGRGSRIVGFDEAETLGEPVVGYLGYDGVARLEPTVQMPESGPGFDESRFVVPELLVRFDHARGVAEVLVGDSEEAARLLDAPQPDAPRGAGTRGELRRHPDRDEHLRRVECAKEHIREGDVFQVVIAQRAERPTSCSAFELYRALRRVNPSPYLFLLELDGVALVGSSPETVVKCEGARAELNPIAGTIAPGEGDAEALLSAEKDRAEHVMLVDLGRNDLSRVCVPGSVHVARFMQTERYSHVTHLVSEVVGELGDDVTPFDLLRACFPAGTVSGAPKVRAMQIISELEQYPRGIYAGAVGYVFPQERAMDACIAIRTLVLRDGVAYLQAGGGIVADSDPAAEHQECLNKLAALEQAIELAES